MLPCSKLRLSFLRALLLLHKQIYQHPRLALDVCPHLLARALCPGLFRDAHRRVVSICGTLCNRDQGLKFARLELDPVKIAPV